MGWTANAEMNASSFIFLSLKSKFENQLGAIIHKHHNRSSNNRRMSR
jgi:hypothetical protein